MNILNDLTPDSRVSADDAPSFLSKDGSPVHISQEEIFTFFMLSVVVVHPWPASHLRNGESVLSITVNKEA